MAKKRSHSHPVLAAQPAPVPTAPCPATYPDPRPPSGIPPRYAGQVTVVSPSTKPVKPPRRKRPRPPVAPAERSEVSRYVSVVVVNYKTQALTREAVNSFVSRYPDVPVLVVDNGSGDNSVGTIQKLARDHPSITAHLLEANIYHGPALDRAFRLLDSPYVLTLDSDTVTRKGGWLEAMLGHFHADNKLYAIGWLRWVNENGVATADGKPRPNLHPYVHPHCALFDRAKYLTLSPFFRDGAPCRVNMFSAIQRGYHLVSFPVERYVTHLVAGTRRMYGGKWDPKQGEKPGTWREDNKYPI